MLWGGEGLHSQREDSKKSEKSRFQVSTEQPQAERGATLTHAVPHPATKGPGLLQPGPRGQVEGASHARGPDSAGRWSALPVGNSELPPAAAAGGKTESPPPGPGVPAALPAAAAPRPPSSWSCCQLPTQQPSGPARHRQGRREEEGGAGAPFAGTGEKGRAGPQTAEGLQGCGRGRPGQKGLRDLAVDVSVLTGQCWPSAGQAPSSPCGRRCHPPTGVGGHPTTPGLHRASQTGAQDVALTAPTQARPELGSCLAPGI